MECEHGRADRERRARFGVPNHAIDRDRRLPELSRLPAACLEGQYGAGSRGSVPRFWLGPHDRLRANARIAGPLGPLVEASSLALRTRFEVMDVETRDWAILGEV